MGRACLWENMKGLDNLEGRGVSRKVNFGLKKFYVTMYTEIFCLRIGTLSEVVINCQVLYEVEKFPDFLTDHLSMIIFHIVNWFETGEGLI